MYRQRQLHVIFLQKLLESFRTDSLMDFYGPFLFSDPDDRPGIFDWKGREKFDRWFALGSLPREDAMREYTKKVLELDLGWQPSKKYPSGFGVRPSTLASANSEDDVGSNPLFGTKVQSPVLTVEI